MDRGRVILPLVLLSVGIATTIETNSPLMISWESGPQMPNPPLSFHALIRGLDSTLPDGFLLTHLICEHLHNPNQYGVKQP